MMLKQYRKLPVVISAFQFDRDEVIKTHVNVMYPKGLPEGKTMTIYLFGAYILASLENKKIIFEIDTLEGMMRVKHKCYVIKGIKDEYYSCDEDIFEKIYDEVT